MTDALEKLISHILNNANNFQRTIETNKNVEFFGNAIAVRTWSSEFMIETENYHIPYQHLVVRVHGSITTENASSEKKDSVFPIHFTSRPKMYGRQ